MKRRNNYQRHTRDIYAINIANSILTEIEIFLSTFDFLDQDCILKFRNLCNIPVFFSFASPHEKQPLWRFG
jgi:hypothetical protein